MNGLLFAEAQINLLPVLPSIVYRQARHNLPFDSWHFRQFLFINQVKGGFPQIKGWLDNAVRILFSIEISNYGPNICYSVRNILDGYIGTGYDFP